TPSLEEPRRARRRHAAQAEVVLDRDGHARERTGEAARGDNVVDAVRVGESRGAVDVQERVELLASVELRDPREEVLRDRGRAEASGAHARGDLAGAHLVEGGAHSVITRPSSWGRGT